MAQRASVLSLLLTIACGREGGALTGGAADAGATGQEVAAPSPDATADSAPDSAPDLGPADLAPAKLELDRPEASFTGAAGCPSPEPVTFRLRNAGASLSGPVTVVFAGPFAAAMDGCSGQSLAAGASCEVEVRFQPVTAGMHTGQMALWAAPGGQVQAMLAGIALVPDSLTVTPISLDFGLVGVGTTSAAKPTEIKNIGGEALTFTGRVQISNTDFLVVSDSCGDTILPPGSTCQVRVAFKPSSRGAKSAVLTATAAGCGGGAIQVSLQATAIDDSLTASPAVLSFGSINVGSASPPRTTTITTKAGNGLGVFSWAIAGRDREQFAVEASTCSSSPAQPCGITVVFRPTSPGDKVAELVVVAAAGATVTVSLSGSGL
jgi:hypothetical protein